MTEVGKETENEELFPEAVFGEKDYLSEVFGLEQHDIRMYSPLTLAYIGDAAYEIVIRTILVRKANMQVNKLHRHAAGLVKAEKQSAMIEILEPLFTEEEKQALVEEIPADRIGTTLEAAKMVSMIIHSPSCLLYTSPSPRDS
mgnify:CR=1 FL=1